MMGIFEESLIVQQYILEKGSRALYCDFALDVCCYRISFVAWNGSAFLVVVAIPLFLFLMLTKNDHFRKELLFRAFLTLTLS